MPWHNGDGKGWSVKTIDGTPVAHNDPVLMSKFTPRQIYEHVKGLRKKKNRTMPVFAMAFTSKMIKEISAYTKTLSQKLQKKSLP